MDDWDRFFKMLSMAGIMRRDPNRLLAFHQEFRHELFALLDWLFLLDVIGADTTEHAAPPGNCDLCSADLSGFRWFIDGQTANGEWANMCPRCFVENGQGLRWGLGQLYLNLQDGRWRLVAGGAIEEDVK